MLGAVYASRVDWGLGLTHRKLRVLAGGTHSRVTLQALPSAPGSRPVSLPRGSLHPMTDWSVWPPYGASAAFRAP